MSRVILLIVGLNTVITVGAAVTGYLYWRPHRSSVQVQQADEASVHQDISEYIFYPIDKIVVNLPGENRENYFLLDLALQTNSKAKAATLKQIEPMLRNAVIGSLSLLKFSDLRVMPIVDLQVRLESDLRKGFTAKGLDVPFDGVLVSKLLVQ
ncbi:flagellar basal body-associated FliL family protein [Pseudomonas chlororaphis subsp. aurantiaca]|uniref:flagellar basal body-associated FliL family protein n=1 Tax=Pseudomonas chlororaphis TaxID=587753 RepID=UPI0027DACBFE|nr:flagellar basal body-associated FliL family protein [Pseudomonas chlororaphis]WMI97613.1 flagellar basal body-associated FliL family protein [Pseudomonas chlororaphis subsp. aurantiaca]